MFCIFYFLDFLFWRRFSPILVIIFIMVFVPPATAYVSVHNTVSKNVYCVWGLSCPSPWLISGEEYHDDKIQ